MSEYNVRTGDNDSSYGTFSTLEAAERALRVVQRLDPEARIVVKYDWRARALMAEATLRRVREVCEDKYVGPPTTYGEGFQNGYNDALYQVLRALDVPCPTCSGPIRETVGLVCQTCGTDYGARR